MNVPQKYCNAGTDALLSLPGDLDWDYYGSIGISEAAVGGAFDSLKSDILALPEGGANKSRDAGRGYAQAIRDVLDLLEVGPE